MCITAYTLPLLSPILPSFLFFFPVIRLPSPPSFPYSSWHPIQCSSVKKRVYFIGQSCHMRASYPVSRSGESSWSIHRARNCLSRSFFTLAIERGPFFVCLRARHQFFWSKDLCTTVRGLGQNCLNFILVGCWWELKEKGYCNKCERSKRSARHWYHVPCNEREHSALCQSKIR